MGNKLVPAWGKAFVASGQEVDVDIAAMGSSAAFRSLIEGLANLGMSVRLIKEEEKLLAQQHDLELVGVPVAREAICVIIHQDNPLEELSLAQLKQIYTGKITNWQQLGGDNQQILVLKQRRTSAHYTLFQELVMEGAPYGENSKSPARIEKISALISAQEKPVAIGFVGIDESAQEGLKQLKINGQAYNQALYPLSRPLYLYTHSPTAGKVKDFLDFCLSEQGRQIAINHHFLPYQDKKKAAQESKPQTKPEANPDSSEQPQEQQPSDELKKDEFVPEFF